MSQDIGRFYIRRDAYGEGLEIRYGWSEPAREGEVRTYLHAAEPIQFKSWKPGEFPEEPMMRLHHREAKDAMQHLLDQLWELGYRPTDIGTAGHLAATAKHLEDMRTIAFAKLDTPKP